MNHFQCQFDRTRYELRTTDGRRRWSVLQTWPGVKNARLRKSRGRRGERHRAVRSRAMLLTMTEAYHQPRSWRSLTCDMSRFFVRFLCSPQPSRWLAPSLPATSAFPGRRPRSHSPLACLRRTARSMTCAPIRTTSAPIFAL